MKTCIECAAEKPADEFYRNTGHVDGLSSRCRTCTKGEMARRWRAKHPEPPPYVPPTEKLCKRCGQTRALDDFHLHSRNRDRRQAWCKTCQSQAVVSGYRNDPQRHREHQRNWSRKNPDAKADIALKTRLGIPHGTYNQMLKAQDGRCAICGTDTPGNTRRFHVDHDNDTGKVRALLCGRCNTGIGQFLHDISRLRKAIAYLQHHSTKGSGI